MNKTTRRYQPLNIPLDGERRETALAVIANLVVTDEQAASGMISRIPEQGRYQLTFDLLPQKAMSFERTVLRAIYSLRDQNIPATTENILKIVRLEIDDADTKLTALLDNHRTTPPDIISLAFAIGDWIERQRMIAGAQRALTILQGAEGNSREAYQQVMQIMTTVAPVQTNVIVRDGVELIQHHRKVQMERQRRYESGKPTGPSWPWQGLNFKVPSLKKGEMCTFQAKKGHGKTTLAVILCEHMAYTLGDEKSGYDMLYLHLETSQESIGDRIIARRCKVLTNALSQPGIFKLDQEPYKSKYDAAQKFIKDSETTRGKIFYEWCPGATPTEIESHIAQHKVLSESRGRELVVIIDYYQKIDWSQLANDETRGFNAVAAFLKNTAESQGVYMINFAQFGMDTDYGQKKGSFGGTNINMVSQVVIRVERDQAQDDLPLVVSGKDGKLTHATDVCGIPIYYHRKGQESGVATFNVIQANDNETGPVPVRYLAGYYEILDDTSRWPQEWNDRLKEKNSK